MGKSVSVWRVFFYSSLGRFLGMKEVEAATRDEAIGKGREAWGNERFAALDAARIPAKNSRYFRRRRQRQRRVARVQALTRA